MHADNFIEIANGARSFHLRAKSKPAGQLGLEAEQKRAKRGKLGPILHTFPKQILILVTISERSSAQPIPPQVLQAGRKCKGELLDKSILLNLKNSDQKPFEQGAVWTVDDLEYHKKRNPKGNNQWTR